MAVLGIGNAPCSWGTLEFEEVKKAEPISYRQMLDELVETGYTGTELGDWGFMPTEPAALKVELEKRKVAMLGAFVPVPLADPSAHEKGVAEAVKVAKLIAAVATSPKPFIVLADNNGTVPERTKNAGRVTKQMGLNKDEWKVFAAGAERVAREVCNTTGLRTVFHHHCAGYVETPEEISRFLELTSPSLINLVFDTGHYVFGSGGDSAESGLVKFQGRIGYVHLKDCAPEVAKQSRAERWDYFQSLRHGVFGELGKGCVNFPSVLRWLKEHDYDGFLLVEQDLLPGMGTPKDSARRNREYLRSIEHNYL